MNVNIAEIISDKERLLDLIRSATKSQTEAINKKKIKNSEKSKQVNNLLRGYKESLINELNKYLLENPMNNHKILEAHLLLDYCIDIVMLEARNKVWKYEYMAFSRRIGELWEPFAKLPYLYPIKELDLYEPQSFESFRTDLIESFSRILDNVDIDNKTKELLKDKYNLVWSFIDSGSIQLNLDLHFSQNNLYYNIDYKSGFGSNEKGNTNRLLVVGSILKMINENNKQLIYVRQMENNNYLEILKNSGLYEVLCGDDAYARIAEHTGFNLRDWMDENMNWEEDISDEFRDYLRDNDLLKYLTW